tara:strand:- start:158 stop:640 length:483 start_codon:yes stop_codon:yes gene_type:complete
MNIRRATNNDSNEIISLITSIYNEYGEIMYTEGADRDLLDIRGNYRAKGGDFIVMVNEVDEIIGSHATLPINTKDGVLTFRRLYLKKNYRGEGAGKKLMDWAVKWSIENQFNRVEFWSDVRFKRAHDFFEKYGFVKSGEIREMNDGALPYSEFFFYMMLL